MVDKPHGLGVLDSYDRLESGLNGIVKALRAADRDRAIKDARNDVKDLKIVLRKSKKEAKQLQKEITHIIKQLTKNVLPLIDIKKK